ncbi:MAG: dihydrodipicolinate synthase family protein [Acidimicrobiia bacterium]
MLRQARDGGWSASIGGKVPPRVMPALVTPFTRDGEPDLEAHLFNLSALWERGVRGFLIAGSTGEGPYLETGERRLLVRAARELLEEAFLICGAASETLRGAVAQAEEVSAAGADALLALTPTSLARGNSAAVRGFYEELAQASSLPVMLYSVPSYTAYELPVELAVELAGQHNMAGMKDSGGQPVRIARLIEEAPKEFLVYAGASAAVALSLAAGAYGAITASANYVPELVMEVVEADSAPQAAPAQARLRELAGVVEAHRIPGVKAAAEAAGLRPGHPRRPLQRLKGPQATEIHRAMAAYLARARPR